MIPPHVVIDTQILPAPAASVTFSDIAALVAAKNLDFTPRHLLILVNGLKTAFRDHVQLQFNGDVGSNYNSEEITGVAAAAAAARRDARVDVPLFHLTPTANAFGGGWVLIPHYLNTDNQKALIAEGGAAEEQLQATAGRWADQDAVTSVTLKVASNDFAIGSSFVLSVVDERQLVTGGEVLLAADGTPTWTGIEAGSGDLMLVGYCRTDRPDITDEIAVELNGDAVAGNYARQQLRGLDGAVTAVFANQRVMGIAISANATPFAFGALIAQIEQPQRAVNDPSMSMLSGLHDSTIPAAGIEYVVARRNNIEAITSVDVIPQTGTNFKAGSLFSLYYVPRRARLIERIVLDVDSPEAVFSGIPQDFDGDEILGYKLTFYARSTRANVLDDLAIEINGDGVAANYDNQLLRGANAVVLAAQSGGMTRLQSVIPGALSAANVFGGGSVLFPMPTRTDRHKAYVAAAGVTNLAASAIAQLDSFRWENLNPITLLRAFPLTGPNFLAGSVFELEAIVEPSPDTVHLTFDPTLFLQTMTINYPGTWLSYPTITITGPVDNPVITNTTTGKVIKLITSIAAGESIIITLSSGSKTVVDGAGVNLLATVTQDSDLSTFAIVPDPLAPNGVNVVTFQGNNMNEATTTFALSRLNRYFGI